MNNVISPWKTCSKGHDLTAENAWLYRSSNQRECRLCAQNITKPQKRRGNFSLGSAPRR
jgi:hypothetical protein